MNWYVKIFANKKTGEKIRFDKGDPNQKESEDKNHENADHYHRFNPNAPKGRSGDKVRYLDCDGNPAPKGSDKSHLYPPEGVTWD